MVDSQVEVDETFGCESHLLTHFTAIHVFVFFQDS